MYKKILLFLCVFLLIPAIIYARPNQIGNQPASQYNIDDTEIQTIYQVDESNKILNYNLDSKFNVFKNFNNGTRYLYSFDTSQGGLIDVEKWGKEVEENIANFFVGIAQLLTYVGITLITWAFKVDLVKNIIHWASTSIKMLMDKNSDIWFLLLTWGTIGLLVYASFLFIKRQIGNIAKAIGIALLGIALSFFFYGNTEQLLTSFDDGINAITGAIIEGYAQLPTGVNQSKSAGSLDAGITNFGDTVWDIIIGKPWAYAMFGTSNVDNLKLTRDEYEHFKTSGGDFSGKFNSRYGNINNDYIDTLCLSTSLDKSRQTVMQILADPAIDHGSHPYTVETLSMNGANTHLLTSVIQVVSSGIFIALAISIAGSMVLYQIMISLMLLFLPIMCMLLFIPVAGWQVSLKYFKTLLGFLLVKLIYGIYLSVVMVCIMLIESIVFP